MKRKAMQGPKILMIGNSYTYYNGGVDAVLRTFGLNVKALTRGGANLQYHLEESWKEGTSHHKALRANWGNETSWDFVIFQDQSHVPALCCHTDPWYSHSSYAKSASALQQLDAAAEARGATPAFYATWGRRDGHATRPYIGTFTGMNDAAINGYAHYASLVSSEGRKPIVGPAGRAFRLIYDGVLQEGGRPSDHSSFFYRLYNQDGSHPSNLGTYLAGCVLYGSLTGESPIGLPKALGIHTWEAEKLQRAAAEAIALQAAADR